MGEAQEPLTIVVTPLYKILLSRLLKFYKDLKWELVKYELTNNTEEPMRVFIETEIADLSYKSPETVNLPPKSKEVRFHSPPTDAHKVDALSKNKSVPLYYDVKYIYIRDGRERLSINDHFDVILLARNIIYWTIIDPQNNDRRISLLDYLVEWIIWDDPSVQSTLKGAISHQGLIPGYQKGQEPNVLIRAIYEELQKTVKLTYLNSQRDITLITIPDHGQIQQAVRLPYESLENGFANCIDGAVLYASLIEAAELDPLIVFSAHKVENSSEFNQGHALVGWRKDKGSEEYEFLETTMTLKAPFQRALIAGNKKYQDLLKDGWFDRKPFDSESFAYLLPVKEIRNKIYGIPKKEKPISTPESPAENALEEGITEPETPFSGTGNHFAVLVGANSYQAEDIYDQKQICPYDAEILYKQLLVNSFHPSRLHLLIDNSFEVLASHRISSRLKATAQASTARDLLLFYYSGAIKQDGQNYFLVTFDMLSGSSTISLAQIRERMVQAAAQAKVLLLDIYNTELTVQDPSIEQLMEEFMNAILEQLKGLTVLASYKQKDKEFASSLFTQELVEEFEQLPGSGNSLTVQHIYDSVSNKITLYPSQPYQAKQTIICRPGQETRSYFLLSYQYQIHMQKSLERVQEILTQKKVTKDDIRFAIKVLGNALEAFEEIEQPEAKFLSIDENKLRDALYALHKRVERLMAQEVQSLLGETEFTITQDACNDVKDELLFILHDVVRKANELRTTIMSDET